ncbi:GNAT family N-acetyltransferase [Pseudomonas sp. NPDC090202]|uniref:GNAT family N-acetyltransferase n=1 Tax=unclassified Pseudomonas TaxID=196821 RepID=UPI0038145EC2
MRRDLATLAPVAALPASLRRLDFTAQTAVDAHRLLVLGRQYGGGQVLDFDSWMNAFEHDPEYDRALCLILADAQGVVAVAQCWTSAFIRLLVVDPRAHRRGIGRALLEHVFALFQQRGEGHVDLKVMENNLPARRLYEQAGMEYVLRSELDPR